MTSDELASFRETIFSSESPEAAFGGLEGSTRDERLESLRRRYLELIARCHPDKHEAAGAEALRCASEIASRLGELRAKAADRIETGTYGDAGGGASGFEIRTKKSLYLVTRKFMETDWSELYSARELLEGLPAGRVVLKIARSEGDEDLFRNEARALSLAQHKSLPVCREAFRTTDKRYGLALDEIDGLDLREILKRKPGGVPQDHVAWIFERLLSVIGFIHSRGIVHGNIEPGNIMVRGRDHNAFLIDFLFAALDPARTGDGFKAATPPYSPPEVYEKKPPVPASDLYALAKSMIFLLGGDPVRDELPAGVDARLGRYLKSFLFPNPAHRPRDAWEEHGRLERLRDGIFGTKRPFEEPDFSPAL